ncbi:bifunctional folylpolyglutamate synthase/dihydrofolate synthase [candidate division KSB1 bacterium]|nr:bifunctional folylpolyglutamate synthase/dihydrofolate synthase [candidate division KSB1 bacterium]
MYKKLNENQAIEYLFGLERFGWKLGLERIHELLKTFDNPHRKVSFVHVAGTNGKGSVSAMLASICRQAGYRTGLYTSPHLQDVRERIRLNGRMIPQKTFTEIVNQLFPVSEELKCTFFEFITALAFIYFTAQKAGIVILETGLGGRFDATNVVVPLLSVITTIDYEHTEHLGIDLVSIAKEKAGIVKKTIPCLIGEMPEEAEKAIIDVCKNNNSAFYRAETYCQCRNINQQITGNELDIYIQNEPVGRVKLPLPGIKQVENARIAVYAVEILRQNGFNIEYNHIIKGLNKVNWPGRFQTISRNPYIIIDVAHHIASFQQISGVLEKLADKYKIIVIFGLLNDKNLHEIVKFISGFADRVVAVQAQSDRSIAAEKIKKEFQQQNIPVTAFNSVSEGLKYSIDNYKRGQLLLITGSHYIAGEALKKIKNLTN